MKKKIEILYDVLKNPYIGIKYYPYELDAYLTEFKKLLNDDEIFDAYSLNRMNRDGENFHTTLIAVSEYNTNIEVFNCYINTVVDINILGIGRVEKGENEAFYLILDSTDLNNIRLENKLNPKDMHITLGFKKKDIFYPKGLDTMVLKL